MIPGIPRRSGGRFAKRKIGGEVVSRFQPAKLPPDPPLGLAPLQLLLEQASQSLGRLDGLSSVLPDSSFFLHSYVRKEALLSSQIEGTQSSLSDLFLFEQEKVPGVPIDVTEVSNDVRAMNHGLDRLGDGFPLSLRLIREIHALLMEGARGSEKAPGEFRTSQNWIGGQRPGLAVFVPPPPESLLEYLGDLESFMHQEGPAMPLLVKAAIIHVQFETIHPFLDGNGRLGRLLITFLLCQSGALSQPLLYLSLYLKQNRESYYELLMRVRTHGDWEAWTRFFLEGVRDTAQSATAAAQRILGIHIRDKKRLAGLGKSAAIATLVFEQFQRTPILAISSAQKLSGLSFPTVAKAAQQMTDLGILREITGKERNRLYIYDEYLDILNEGAEPLRRAGANAS